MVCQLDSVLSEHILEASHVGIDHTGDGPPRRGSGRGDLLALRKAEQAGRPLLFDEPLFVGRCVVVRRRRRKVANEVPYAEQNAGDLFGRDLGQQLRAVAERRRHPPRAADHFEEAAGEPELGGLARILGQLGVPVAYDVDEKALDHLETAEKRNRICCGGGGECVLVLERVGG